MNTNYNLNLNNVKHYIHIYFMKHTLKDKLRIAGISLKDIAKATNTHHSAVCTVLDEELRKKVEAKAKDMLVKKFDYINKELSEID